MSIRIDKQRFAEALRDVLPKLAISIKLVETNEIGEYCEEFSSQISCMPIDPNTVCVQSVVDTSYCVHTYSVETTTETYRTAGDIVEHTHTLARKKARVIIVFVR